MPLAAILAPRLRSMWFFSSRRRHTRYWRDWSSDVCSSDLRSDLAAAFATRTRDEWVADLMAADTCVAPVLSVPELVDDAHFVARGAVVDAIHPVEGAFRQVAPVLAGAVRPDRPEPVPDAARTDSDELLEAAGFSVAERSKLREAGVVA